MRFLSLGLLLGFATPVWAATFCVPNGTISTSCPNVRATIQEAINDATAGSLIRVGTGNTPERIIIDRRIRIDCLGGAILTDVGLPPGDRLISFTGTFTALSINNCVMLPAGDGILVPNGVTSFKVTGLTMTGVGGVGILVDGAVRPTIESSVVSGFDTAVVFNEATWYDLETSTLADNGIGVNVHAGRGQIFWNSFSGNDVAVYANQVFQADINSNNFLDNSIALEWLHSNALTEFHHSVIVGGVPFRVWTTPGTFVDGPQAYLQDPGCATQWQDIVVDGIQVQSKAFKTGAC